jgi:hypothetical protein
MAITFLLHSVIGVTIVMGLLSGCAPQFAQPRISAASYCEAEGSEMAINQCKQYYAKNQVEPPQPADYQSAQSAMDQHDRAMIVAAFLSRSQFQPQPLPFAAPIAPAYIPPSPASINCTSNRMGNVVSTTCN